MAVSFIVWLAMLLTWLTICVAEDIYSSEETVDHQPVHLRVMDTADLVTLLPCPRSPIPRETRPSVQPLQDLTSRGHLDPFRLQFFLCVPEGDSDFSGPESFIWQMK